MKSVYKCFINDKVYIGSTKNLKERIVKHRSNIYDKNDKKYNYKIYKYIRENNINFNDIIFFVLEEHEHNKISKLELRKREQYYIDLYNSIENGLNDKRAYQTNEQRLAQKRKWCENNREKHLTLMREWRENNRENFLVQMREWGNKRVKCDICGKELNQGSLTRHKRRKH